MTRRYAFDIDGVICCTREAHKAALEEELGVLLLDGGDYESFGFWHPDSFVMERVREVALDLWRRPTVFTGDVASGARLLHSLACRGAFAGYVTRRHSKLYTDTLGWLSRHDFPLKANGHYALLSEPPIRRHRQLLHMDHDATSKTGAARTLGATHLIEDSPHEAWNAARDGMNVIVLRKPYNAAFEAKWQENRAEPAGPDADIWCRIDFITTLEELL